MYGVPCRALARKHRTCIWFAPCKCQVSAAELGKSKWVERKGQLGHALPSDPRPNGPCLLFLRTQPSGMFLLPMSGCSCPFLFCWVSLDVSCQLGMGLS